MSQDRVRDWWNRNPMSYDVDDPIPYEHGSAEYFRELDSRVFDHRVLRLTRSGDGPPFSRFVDFPAARGRDVLEMGCGSGFASQLFAEAGATVTAVDLTDWAIETTTASFDIVFSWGVIHHTSDMDQALRELIRVLRPGGTLVLMVYHRHSLFYAFYKGFQRFLPVARRLGLHFEGSRAGETEGLIARHFTRDELKRKLEAAGLSDVRIQPYGQDAELLPLPRKVRVPITDRLPERLKDAALDRLGHQLAVTALKPAG